MSTGWELLCHAKDCIHNDDPACEINVKGKPAIVGKGGLCKSYEKKVSRKTKKEVKKNG